MRSGQCLSLINKYSEILESVSGLFVYLDNSAVIIKMCKPLMDETIIDGEPIDKGVLENVSLSLEELKNAFNTVIAECRSKISYYERLYNIALRDESKSKVL